MKPYIYIISLCVVLLYNGCSHDKPIPIEPEPAPVKPKTYPDLTGQWGFSYQVLKYIDTSNGQVNFQFYSFSERETSTWFELYKQNDSNTLYQVRCFYPDSAGINGSYFIRTMARIDTTTDSISIALYNEFKDSIGTFTAKYDPLTKSLKGNFYTYYQIYCFCRFAGVKLPYTHHVSATN